MRAQHQIDVQVGQERRIIQLLAVGLALVFRAPVHGDDHGVGHLLRATHVGLDGRLVEAAQMPRVRKVFLKVVVAIAEGQKRERHAVALHQAHRLAVGLAAIAAGAGDARIGVPYVERALGCLHAVVQHVVGGQVDQVEAGFGQGVGRRVGRVEARVAGIAVLVRAGHDGLLVDEAQVALLHERGDLLVERREVVDAVARRAPCGVRQLEHLVGADLVACRHERHPVGPGACLPAPPQQVVHAGRRGAVHDAVLVHALGRAGKLAGRLLRECRRLGRRPVGRWAAGKPGHARDARRGRHGHGGKRKQEAEAARTCRRAAGRRLPPMYLRMPPAFHRRPAPLLRLAGMPLEEIEARRQVAHAVAPLGDLPGAAQPRPCLRNRSSS